uniref:Uncharacterized protein n=1 Tax=Physcomitrium patens TaxID=3218 RepID=A0A2K1J342_PHYPA|nr:hypothetical protein PHYPA_021791 [Physcomitrium patens]
MWLATHVAQLEQILVPTQHAPTPSFSVPGSSHLPHQIHHLPLFLVHFSTLPEKATKKHQVGRAPCKRYTTGSGRPIWLAFQIHDLFQFGATLFGWVSCMDDVETHF